jgi:hypothetical protein
MNKKKKKLFNFSSHQEKDIFLSNSILACLHQLSVYSKKTIYFYVTLDSKEILKNTQRKIKFVTNASNVKKSLMKLK